MEILEQVQDIDAVVVPTGGGGLLAGVAVAIKTLQPQIKVIVSNILQTATYLIFSENWLVFTVCENIDPLISLRRINPQRKDEY